MPGGLFSDVKDMSEALFKKRPRKEEEPPRDVASQIDQCAIVTLRWTTWFDDVSVAGEPFLMSIVKSIADTKSGGPNKRDCQLAQQILRLIGMSVRTGEQMVGALPVKVLGLHDLYGTRPSMTFVDRVTKSWLENNFGDVVTAVADMGKNVRRAVALLAATYHQQGRLPYYRLIQREVETMHAQEQQAVLHRADKSSSSE